MTMLVDAPAVVCSLPPVLGYVGPGPGLNMAWALVGLVVTVFAAASAVLFWPLRIVLRKWRERRPTRSVAGPPDP